jgi:hypothetical protein
MTEETGAKVDRDWFAVERRVFKDSMFAGEPYSKRDAWLWLIANAAKRDHHVRTRSGIIELKRGEVIVARDHLAKEWGWTAKRVRTFLAHLSASERIKLGQSAGHYPAVAKISNYATYQTPKPDAGPVNGPDEGHSRASGGPHPYTYKEQRKEIGPAPTVSQGVDRAILNGALADYNRAAEVIGFASCTTLTDQRAKALAKRLADIGGGDLARGAERFRDALAAIPHDRFLAGKAPPRDSTMPFRLNLDRLLSTASGMGDVLGKLLDLHDEHGPAAVGRAVPPRREANSLDLWREAQAEELAAQRTRYDGDGHVH